MAKKKLSLLDDELLRQLKPTTGLENIPYPNWLRIIRAYLRMSQEELAHKAKIPQSHIAAIETGKTDPRLSTIEKIFNALSFRLEPRPYKPLNEMLKGRARSIALKRLKQSTGSMALEDQAPDAETFRQLLEKQTNQILNDPHEKLWHKPKKEDEPGKDG